MKFKQEDIGLYLAFALVGGGLGLLAGAMLANYLERRREEEAIEEEADENELADEIWAKEQAAREEAEAQAAIITEEESRQSHNEVMAAQAEKIATDEEYTVEQNMVDKSSWEAYSESVSGAIEKRPRKKNERRPNTSQYTDEELEDFIAEHQPNIQMMEMLRNGGMDMEQVLGVIQLEEEALNLEPTNYNAPYFESAVAEAEAEGNYEPEELVELVEDLGTINGRFQVLTGPPDDASERIKKEIQWDPEDNSFLMLRRGQPLIYDIRTGIGHDTWEAILPLMLRGLHDIYVVDLERNRYYMFHKLAGLDEDDPSEHGSE